MPVYSAAFAQIYDEIMGDYSDIIRAAQTLVYKYTTNKKTPCLLELGCGTGNVLKVFPKSFTLFGLDITPAALAIARKKVEHATFIEGDMSSFSLRKKFDVIISVFDTINHLQQFSQWEQMFSRVAYHLKPNGVFIFDMNTQKRHKALVNLPAYIKKGKKRLVCIKVHAAKPHVYYARFEIFSNLANKNVTLLEQHVYEASFPTERVKQTLRKYFTIEEMVDPYREHVSKDTGRIFFVCKKSVRGKKQKTITAS